MSSDSTPSSDRSPPTVTGREATQIEADTELLSLVSHVLEAAGYSTQLGTVDDVPFVLCENADNVVAATAVLTVAALIRAEPWISRALVDRLGAARAPGKRWDGYVLLLTSQASAGDSAEALFAVTYNLRQVRRIARVGVELTIAGVARALRPVLPLPELPATSLEDPVEVLRQRLIGNGVDSQAVEVAITRLKASARPTTIGEDWVAEDLPDGGAS